MSNVYYESIEETPFGILVLPDIAGGFRWFITLGDIETSDNEYVVECIQPLATPYEAVEVALDQAVKSFSLWQLAVRQKQQRWLSQK